MGISERGEGNERRRDRLAKLRKGPGVFAYRGGAYDTEYIPTPLMVGHDDPVLDADGLPVVDAAGRAVMQRQGMYVRDANGNPVLGGAPKIKRRELEVVELRGVSFPLDEPIEVSEPSIALKLRCMSCFEELDSVTIKEEDNKPRRRSRKPKAADSVEE